MRYEPVEVFAPTLIVMIDVPAPGAGIGFGLKVTVAPVGTPADPNVISLLKPPVIAAVIVEDPVLPRRRVTAEGRADKEKPGLREIRVELVST